MDTKINVYLLSIFLKVLRCCDNFDSNISAQHFVNMEKFTFEIDDLRKSRRKMRHYIGM